MGRVAASQSATRCRLAIHVVDPSVTREISSGRIDIVELLQPGSIRFWAEIVENGVLLERRMFQKDDFAQLQTILDDLDLPPRCWTFMVSPSPGIADDPDPILLLSDTAAISLSLRKLGVVPGSVLHFRRHVESRPITR